jgi:hypothetical protein
MSSVNSFSWSTTVQVHSHDLLQYKSILMIKYSTSPFSWSTTVLDHENGLCTWLWEWTCTVFNHENGLVL